MYSGSNSFVSVTPARTGADYYYETGFGPEAGNLNPGATAEFQVMFRKNDFSYYMQANDYSFSGTTVFAATTKVTAYRSGVLIYGVEPP